LCGHKIKVRLIPFSEAREGVELCYNKSIGHHQAAVTLFKANDYVHALFMVLTGYEEMAKCSRILDAAHFSNRMGMRNMAVEDSVFSEHESKYQITMNYLDEWLPSLDEIRLKFMKHVRSVDPPKQKASRKKLFRHGFKIRNACLYVDYRKGWVSTQNVSKNEVLRNLGMLASMMGGFHSSLTNWGVAIS
jgi:AbiV family abortive infection protein